MNSSKQEVSTKLAQLIDDIRTRYTIGYYPSVTQPKGAILQNQAAGQTRSSKA